MCWGEGGSDTLDVKDQIALKEAVSRHLPSYACDLLSNDDAMTWAVLRSTGSGPTMPRFTICRIDPCFMVMVEDQAERRFSSVATIEDAIAFTCQATVQAVLAIHNVHLPSGLMQ